MSYNSRQIVRRLVAVVLVLTIAVAVVVAVALDEPVVHPVTNLVLTAALVWFTAELVREGRLTREARFAPAVAVYLRLSSGKRHAMELVVENYGGGPAHDITLEIDDDLILRKGARLGSEHVARNGLKYLPPKGNYSTVIGDSELLRTNAGDEAKLVPSVRVLTRCAGISGRKYEHVSWLDLPPRVAAAPAIVRAADSLESIAMELSRGNTQSRSS